MCSWAIGGAAMVVLGACADDGPLPAANGDDSTTSVVVTDGGAGASSTSGSLDSGTDQSTAGTTQDTSGGSVPTTAKSLMIAIDGLRPDALEAAVTPVLDTLIDGTWQPGYAGAYAPQAQCLTDADSVSGPNHWAIMTGATGLQHGVTNNRDVASGDAENFPHYLSLLERADSELHTAYLFTWYTDIQIPCEADYIVTGTDAANAAIVAEILAQNHDDPEGIFETQWTAGTDPDAIFLFLDDVDGAGHASGYGPRSEEYLLAIGEIDDQVGQILDALAARPSFNEESWQIVITSDHGGIGMGHGGTTPEELTIPFLVVSRDVTPGMLPAGTEAGGTRIFDTVPTALQHMGVDVPRSLTGHSRGG